MTLAAWIPYAVGVSLLFAVAAWLLERAARNHDLPRRGLHAAALAGSVALSLVAVVRPSPVRSPIGPAGAPSEPPLAVPAPLASLAGSASLPTDWDPFLAAGWTCLSVALALLFLLAFVRLARARTGWAPARVDGRQVLLSGQVGPAVVGFFRPEIVVPRWCLEMRPDARELMLRHEEEHRRAGDHLLLTLGLGLVILFPWNPPLWWLLGRLRLGVEIDCDRRVVRDSDDLRPYADLLVEISRRGSLAHRVGALAFARPVPFLERRIRAMTHRPSRRLVRTFASVALAGLLVLGACRMDRPAPLEPEPAAEVVAAPGDVEDIGGESAGSGDAREIEGGSYTVRIRTGGDLVTGVVLHDDRPVEGAQVHLPGADMGGLTNRQGRFLLLNVPEGRHLLRVTHSAHAEDWEAEVLVRGPAARDAEGVTRDAAAAPRRAGRRPSTAPSMAPGRGVVTGTVVRSEEGEPLESAQVFLPELDMGGLTNAQGRFLLLNVPAGRHTLTLTHSDHGRWTVEVEVVEGRTVSTGPLSPPGG